MTPLVVTGTGTEVGKTIVTAALAAIAHANGVRVAAVKPAQTGVADGEDGDVDVVRRLSGVDDVHELVRYREPLAPAAAARVAGMPCLSVADMAIAIRRLDDRDLVLVEGAGGLLVRFDDRDATLADLAADLDADVVVVAAAGLGTLNATALTCEALRTRGLRCAGIVIGSWPAMPDLAARENLDDLAGYADAPLLGAMPEGAGSLAADAFREMARAAIGDLPVLQRFTRMES